jgi:hypothetical protein
MSFIPSPGAPDMIGIVSAFVAQVGARHLIFNFSDIQKKIISHPITQACILFGMFYLSTRKIVFAVGLLVLYYVVLFVLINEQHPFNIIPKKMLISEGLLKPDDVSPIELYYENVKKLP